MAKKKAARSAPAESAVALAEPAVVEAPSQPTQPAFRDRVKELRRVRAGDIVPSDKNWRTHPDEQRSAMRGVLREIGYADALLARELPDGRLMLIDGHLRRETTPNEIVPVLVLDVDENEADKLLLTLDPLAAMAETDDAKLAALASEIEFGEASLRLMLDDLASGIELDEFVGGGGDGSDSAMSPNAVLEEDMELKPEEHYDFVVVMADNVNDWNRLVSLLGLKTVISSRRHQRIGMARAVRAGKVLELIDKA